MWPRPLDFGSFVAFFAFRRSLIDASLSFKSEVTVLFIDRRFVLGVSSVTFGWGKNREREGNENSSEGEGRDGGVSIRGDMPNVLSKSTSVFVGVCGRRIGEEDRTITSAEFVIVASGALKMMKVRSGRV